MSEELTRRPPIVADSDLPGLPNELWDLIFLCATSSEVEFRQQNSWRDYRQYQVRNTKKNPRCEILDDGTSIIVQDMPYLHIWYQRRCHTVRRTFVPYDDYDSVLDNGFFERKLIPEGRTRV